MMHYDPEVEDALIKRDVLANIEKPRFSIDSMMVQLFVIVSV